MQKSATHCHTLQHQPQTCHNGRPKHCNPLYHTATHCITLQHAASHCITLQQTVTHCNTHCNTHLKNVIKGVLATAAGSLAAACPQKSPIFFRQNHLLSQMSPTFPQKSPILDTHLKHIIKGVLHNCLGGVTRHLAPRMSPVTHTHTHT